MNPSLDFERLRRTAASDPARAQAEANGLRRMLDAIRRGDFTDLPPDTHVEEWAAELTQAIAVLDPSPDSKG